jgi:hypothetical protein
VVVFILVVGVSVIMLLLSTFFLSLSRYCRCISCAGKEASDPDAGSDLVYLIALAEEGAPKETLEDWHLRLGEELPEAAKFWAYGSAEAKQVHFSLDRLSRNLNLALL